MKKNVGDFFYIQSLLISHSFHDHVFENDGLVSAAIQFHEGTIPWKSIIIIIFPEMVP